MPRTRTSKPTSTGTTEPSSQAPSKKYALPEEDDAVSKLFILPSRATSEAKSVVLRHPRTGRPARYLVCPETGIYELTKISVPSDTPRSWLIERSAENQEGSDAQTKAQCQASTIKSPDLYVATSIDPVFLILPSLVPKAEKRTDDSKRLFLSLDDHLENIEEESNHITEILRWGRTRQLLESRFAKACDTVEAGDEIMFRLNETKLFALVLGKARNLADGSLPPSMEEKFVKKALEAPMLVQRREQPGVAPPAAEVESQVSTPRTDSNESQSTAVSADASTSAASQLSTAATSFTEDAAGGDFSSGITASPEVLNLKRLEVAFNFICSSYVPREFASTMQQMLSEGGQDAADFAPLHKYQAKLAELRAEALAARSVTDYTRKRGRDEEDDFAREDKKRKLEEEKRKKASETRGLRDLKKVNTSGMMKLSSFFKKK